LSLGIFDISDTGIQVSVGDNPVILSPGYAVLDGDNLLLGDEAIRNARLLPRWTNNRFWDQLNLDPLANGSERIRHHADLAFAHLDELWHDVKNQVDEVILSVPGSYDKQKLGLLLGMTKECGIPVRGVVDAATAAVSEQQPYRCVLHLDVQLHRIVLTELERGIQLRRIENTTVTEIGLYTLMDRWAHTIAQQFIHTNRFDPMHQAESEQVLFDHLAKWIENCNANSSNTFELPLGDITHSVSISGDQLLKACTEIYPQIVQQLRTRSAGEERVQLCISHRFRGFPGLLDSLALLDNCDIVLLEQHAVSKGILKHLTDIRSEGDSLTHITTLPSDERTLSRPLSVVPAAATETMYATHILHGNRALPIDDALKLDSHFSDGVDADEPQCTIYRRDRAVFLDNHSSAGTLINGEAVKVQTELKPGDEIQLGTEKLILISVENSHGS
jgi:hypothetical protein